MKQGFLLLGVVGLLTAGCARNDVQNEQSEQKEIRCGADIKGYLCGSVTGTAIDQIALSLQPDLRFSFFNDYGTMVEALLNGKIDALAIDTPLARRWVAQRPNDLKIAFHEGKNPYGFFFAKDNPLRDRFNEVLCPMIASGEVKRIITKWCDATDINSVQFEPIPELPANCEVLKVSAGCEEEPGAFLRGGKPVGFDVDIVRIVAARLGKRIEVIRTPTLSRITAVQVGKVDMGAGCITISDERKKIVDFSEAYLDDGFSVVICTQTGATKEESFLSALKASFVRTFIFDERWKLMASGLGVTLLITVLSSIFGTLLAFPVWLARTSVNKIASALARGYISIMEGTPILVLLMILFYVVFGKVDIDGIWIAVLGFSLNTSAYLGEALRSGIDSVPRGQTEAALALGYGEKRAFFRFVLPQAFQSILPVYRGVLISVLKATSIVGYVAINDLTKASDLIRSRTYESLFPILTTAFIYFVAAWIMAFLLNTLGKKLEPRK